LASEVAEHMIGMAPEFGLQLFEWSKNSPDYR
jgi:division protein CdvB (Snf7/Vps24/ESCRT-III family)